MSKRLKAKPKFAGEAAERAFCEQNDSTGYLDWKKAQLTVLPNLKPSIQTISLRLPQHLLDSIKTAANALLLLFFNSRARATICQALRMSGLFMHLRKNRQRPALVIVECSHPLLRTVRVSMDHMWCTEKFDASL